MDISVVPLHHHPEYIKDCCNLINQEWRRSETARLHSLKASCDSLPVSLILLKNKCLVGHAKLSPIPSKPDACFVESVVINKEDRGKGYGSILMKEAEEYCRCLLNLNILFLSTRGQEEFYKKLGYMECMPVSLYSNYVPKNIENKETSVFIATKAPPPPPLPKNEVMDKTTLKTFMQKNLI
ncbi:N-alpha-acetyltransferase 80 [Cylas formicarius]|uniref:N-alpha-acetyltransferase 80 n=1 Tax=Cylas formicarius TaxID=197179 RepID=UPI002958BE4B|nr:N-alpha-acetyltransferase 80 [Cylas formicarius]